MSDEQDNYQTQDITINKKTELSLIWLLPLIALLVSGWLVYKALSEKGSTITIDFYTAEGLEVGKTKIKYLDVEIGKVTAITINPDLKTIAVSAEMNRDAENYLTDKSRFWVVRPQVSLGGISGLNTLLSGAYIAIKPEKGNKKTHFMGLATPPLIKTEGTGTQFVLEANELGSMRAGTPINFHGINVGEVLNHHLDTTANMIHLTVFINAPYDGFVRKNTRFWIDSGIELSASAEGVKVRSKPLIYLLSGGIAFRTDMNNAGEAVVENTVFNLYDSYEQTNQEQHYNTIKYVLYFTGSVRGLTEGAPVQLRGIPIGKVTHINLELDEKTADIRIPVEVELYPERIKVIHNLPNVTDKEMVAQLINKGLRAQLQTGSLLTGQLLIDLDFHANSKPVAFDNSHDYAEFPTVASSLDQITHSAQTIMDKMAKLPLEDLIKDTSRTLQTLQGTSTAATALLKSGKTTLETTDKTMLSANQVLNSLESGSTTRYELDRLLQELTQTANSVKQLTDYLQQHPDTVLRGKKE
jgi:paraquat-inducible protein B